VTVFLPTPGQALVDPRTGHFTGPYRRWANALTEAVNAAQGSTATVPAEPVSFVISGAGSVTADGSVAGGEFVVTLIGDKDSPPPNSFYGTTTAGDKGFVPVYDALVEGTGIAIRDSGYIVIDTVETPDDLPLTGNSGEAVRVTGAEPGLYAWDGAAFTIDTAPDGSVSVALDTLADSGAGTFKLLTRDTYGRLSGTKSGAASDVPYSNTTSGLAATDVQAAVDEVAVKVASGTVNPTSPYPNQRFWREDIHQLIYYDAVGLQWLTVQQFPLELPAGDGNPSITVSGQRTGRGAVRQDLQLYLSRWDCNAFVVGTNNASNYWTITLSWVDSANTQTTLAAFNTASDSVANNVVHSPALGVVLPTGAKALSVTGTKTGSPGALYAYGPLAYRLIVP
jgi:hypothetical protein